MKKCVDDTRILKFYSYVFFEVKSNQKVFEKKKVYVVWIRRDVGIEENSIRKILEKKSRDN